MLTKRDILTMLRRADIEPGDAVAVHSSLRRVGKVDGGADAIIDALLEAVGPDGHIAMPTMSYAHIGEGVYDRATTPSVTGTLTEIFRQRSGAVRSEHPTHSITVMGPRAAEFAADHLTVECVGIGSPLDKLAQAGGKVLLMGVSQVHNTTVHVGEAHAGVRKALRWGDHPPCVKARLHDGRIVEHALDASASCSLGFDAVSWPLRRDGGIRDVMIGGAVSHLMRGRDVIAATVELCRAYPGILFCTRIDCERCEQGRTLARG